MTCKLFLKNTISIQCELLTGQASILFCRPMNRFLLASDGPELPCSHVADIYGGRNALSEPSHIPFIANEIQQQKRNSMNFDNVLRHAYNNSIVFFDLSTLGELYALLPDDTKKPEEVSCGAVEDFDIEMELQED